MNNINGNLFFGFALADSMLSDGAIQRQTLSTEEAKALLTAPVISCLNPSHTATIDAMRQRFDINISIPTTPPQVKLVAGDRLIVLGVRGLPRLTDRHEYTEQEIAQASFAFTMYTQKD